MRLLALLIPAVAGCMAWGFDMEALSRPQNYAAERASSWNPTGANGDMRPVAAGETLTFATLEGPGRIVHLWFTINPKDREYLANLILRITWDDASEPAVESPWGAFFGMGHNAVNDLLSAPFVVMASTGPYRHCAAFNCYWTMPFHRRAVLSVENRGPQPVNAFYWHVDWRREKRIPKDERYFHATYLTEQTSPGQEPGGRNVTHANDYVILDAAGAGHYAGCTLHVESHQDEAGKWYEGDEIITVDGEPIADGINGTGSEDYFNMAWGVRRPFQSPYFGFSYHAWNPDERTGWCWGKFSVYRFHIPDPIPFRKSIRVSIEHGHNNDAANRYQSVAYWYGERP